MKKVFYVFTFASVQKSNKSKYWTGWKSFFSYQYHSHVIIVVHPHLQLILYISSIAIVYFLFSLVFCRALTLQYLCCCELSVSL